MPLLEEYPQGYWEGNQFILPTLPPPPQQEVFQAPVAAAPPPVSPLLRARPLLEPYDYDGGGYMGPMDPMDPMDPTAPDAGKSAPGSPFSFSNPFGTESYGTNLGRGGTLFGGVAKAMGAPVFGLGLLGRAIGTAMDVSDAEAELASRYAGLEPDLSFWGAFNPWGKSAVEQQMDEMNALQDYYSEPDPTSEEAIADMIGFAEAAEAWGGYETSPPDAPEGGGYGGGGYGGAEEGGAMW